MLCLVYVIKLNQGLLKRLVKLHLVFHDVQCVYKKPLTLLVARRILYLQRPAKLEINHPKYIHNTLISIVINF